MRGLTILSSLTIFALGVSPALARGALSDDQIRKAIIRESIAQYPGNCPCPYNSASNGSSCGRRSAWNRAGGYAPSCYPKDVSQSQIKQYRQNH